MNSIFRVQIELIEDEFFGSFFWVENSVGDLLTLLGSISLKELVLNQECFPLKS